MKVIGPNAIIAALFLCSSLAALLIVTAVPSSATNDATAIKYTEPPVYTATVVKAESNRTTRDSRAQIAKTRATATTEEAVTVVKQANEPEVIIPVETTPVKAMAPEPEAVPVVVQPTEVAVKQKVTTPPKTNQVTTNTFEAKVIAEVQRLVNLEREKDGLTSLTTDNKLSETAEQKVQSIKQNNYFDHTDPDGCDFTCLLKQNDYHALAWGENLMQYSSTKPPSAEKLASVTVKSWLKSSGHRENVLNPDYTHTGTAVIKDGGTYYIVSHYALPK